MRPIIHWFWRDLRITDNTALHSAYSRGEAIVPVFIWDDTLLGWPHTGSAARTFLARSLASLEKNLAQLGHRLIIRRGSPEVELLRLVRETGATEVHTNRDYEPQSVVREQRVAEALAANGGLLRSYKDLVVWEGREILTGSETPYTVYTPYAKSWRTRTRQDPWPKLGPAKNPVRGNLPSLSVAEVTPSAPPAAVHYPLAGEHAALESLKAFLSSGVFKYDTARDFPALTDGTSRLSPHLRVGTLGIRTAFARLTSAFPAEGGPGSVGCRIWENELIWREFYNQVLANFPQVATACFRSEYDRLKWSGTRGQFAAWCAGQTGYPIVDAAMRCLNATGWMHNRLRMIVASFLTKDLLISWQEGERYFYEHLVDADLAANTGGWQWSAGTGTDAAPYFRIFNPASQGAKFDPEGEFIRRWVPELKGIPTDLIQTPSENPLLLARCKYPAPIVDHAVQRGRCLAMFKAVGEVPSKL